MVRDCINLCESDFDFCMWLYTKKVHGNRYQILKWPFLHHLVIFKDSVNFFMLSTGLLMQGQFSLILIDIAQ